MKSALRLIGALITTLAITASCGKSEDGNGTGPTGGSPEETGSTCEADNDCFPGVAEGGLRGEALCLTRVRDGYCTHTCEMDSDCCAVPGECRTDFPQVCSPFESTGMMMCFLSCEDADIADAGAEDEQAFCQRYASSDFICRSSGGGDLNRKICVPGACDVGADCNDDADCNGLECIAGFPGGYCTRRDCVSNDDCPANSLCVSSDDGNNYCYKSCASASDCSFCRHDGLAANCSDAVTFAEDGTTGSVCVPSL